MREYIIKVMNDKPLSALKAGETIQAVMKTSGDCDELIRCKDCKHYKWEIDMCNLPGATVFPMNVVHEDDFCSRAERKEE